MKTNLSGFNIGRISLATLALATFVFTPPLMASATPKDSPNVVTDSMTISIQPIGHLKFRVWVGPQAGGKTTVLIGNGVSKERLYYGSLPQKGQQSQVFDLSPLADGSYYFEVHTGKQTRTETFDIKTEISRMVLVAGQ